MRKCFWLSLLAITPACYMESYHGALFWGQDGARFMVSTPCFESDVVVPAADSIGLEWARVCDRNGIGYETAIEAFRGRQVCMVEQVQDCVPGQLAVGCSDWLGDGSWVAKTSPRGPVDWRAVLVHELGHVLQINAQLPDDIRVVLEPEVMENE